jgi:hypothetical protein
MKPRFKKDDFVKVVDNHSFHGMNYGEVAKVIEVVDHYPDGQYYYRTESLLTGTQWAVTEAEIETVKNSTEKGTESMNNFTRDEIVLIASTMSLYIVLEGGMAHADFQTEALQRITKLGEEMRAETGQLDGVRAAAMLEDIARKLLAHADV